MTPSEALDRDGDALCSIPSFTQKQSGFPGDYFVASPAESRASKQRAIALQPKKYEKIMDYERDAVLFHISIIEAKRMAHFHSNLEALSRNAGDTLRMVDNRLESENERPSQGVSSSTADVAHGPFNYLDQLPKFEDLEP